MKKFILSTFIIVSILAVGCAMNSKNPTSDKAIQQTTSNMDKLINVPLKDVEKSFGTPYSSIYYIDTNNLTGKDIDSLTMDDIGDSVTILSTYKNNDKKSNKNNEYLHVYYENGKVKNALTGEYDLSTSDKFNTPKVSEADYKVEFFKGKGLICGDDFNLEYAKQDFINKKIEDFNKNYGLKSSNFIASTINNVDKIYFYPLVPHKVYPSKEHKHPNYNSNHDAKLDTVNPVNNNISTTNKTNNKNLADYAKSAVLVYTKDGVIKSMEIVDNNFVMGLITKTFTK